MNSSKSMMLHFIFHILLPPAVSSMHCGSRVAPSYLILIVNIAVFQCTCLYAQDLECDVSVEDDNRQEWIFTLYDFDNSGKVTKEVCV